MAYVMAKEEDIAYYAGSRSFWWLSRLTGLQIDQVNFLLSQLTALLLGIVLRIYLHPKKVSTQIRHAYSCSVGIGMLYFCFGYHIFHVLIQAFTCYTILRTVSPKSFQRVVMLFALSYLSSIHLMRQFYNYGSYTLDITGPLMVITQKVTSLAFSLHDGLARSEDELNSDQKKQAVKEMPSLLEYLSYCFHFQALMCGPMIFYKDYMNFIEGEKYSNLKNPILIEMSNSGSNGHSVINEYDISKEPCPDEAVIKKVTQSIIYALILLSCLPMFPIHRAAEHDFLEQPLYSKLLFLMAATMLVRTKYYHAWLLADGICNSSGLGFNGYDAKGKPKWDGVSNVDAVGFELGLNLKGCLDHWNRSTGLWLRRVAYDRTPVQPTLSTFCLSAIWHGFYPGYYLTFLTGALFTAVSRKCRKVVRPYFQTSNSLATTYDVITFAITKVAMAYVTFPFVLLEFWASIHLYWSMYFCIHVLTVLVWIVTYFIPMKASTKTAAAQPSSLQNGTIANGKKNH